MDEKGGKGENGRKMKQINIQYYKTRIGELTLGSFDGSLCLLDFRYRRMRATVDHRIKQGLAADFVEKDGEVLSK
jgi:methylated-DNA-[protein]-cysteine S-methyltransferase